jgi:hypothetical protein
MATNPIEHAEKFLQIRTGKRPVERVSDGPDAGRIS